MNNRPVHGCYDSMSDCRECDWDRTASCLTQKAILLDLTPRINRFSCFKRRNSMISPPIPIVTVGKDGRQYRKGSAVSRKLKKASSYLTENSAWIFPIMDELPDTTQRPPAADAFLLERPMTPFTLPAYSTTLRQDYNNFRISPTSSVEGKNAPRVRFE